METYEHLVVDSGELANALENRLDEGAWLLDLESGEVLLVQREELDEDPEENDYEDPDRFLPILPMSSRDAFQIMEEFIGTLPGGEGCRALERALRLPRPFRSFKDTLLDFPELREQWFKFHHGRMLQSAQEWLEDNLPGARLGIG
jgi:hypothetical protein